MNISIDATAIRYNRGVSRYTSNLITHLQQQSPSDSITPFIFGHKSLPQANQLQNCTTIPVPVRFAPFVFGTLPLRVDTFLPHSDILHAWDWFIPNTKAKIVTTIHDLSIFKFPDIAHPQIVRHHRKAIKRAIAKQAHFIAISQATARDLQHLFSITPDQISVIYEALPLESAYVPSQSDIDHTRSHYDLPAKYFVLLGVNEPRKNFANMISAWEAAHVEQELVIISHSGWDKPPVHPKIRVLSQVSHQQLAAILRASDGLLYASLYEGFGLPILEAYYHSAPVLTSNNSGMKEIAQDAAVLVEPTDISSMSRGIHQLLTNSSSLITKGQQRLKAFSWEKTASQTLEVYRQQVAL